MVLIFVTFIMVTAVFGIVLLTIKGPSCMHEPANSAICSQEQAVKLGSDFITGCATFKFDGIEGSIESVKVEPGRNGQSWQTGYTFRTLHPGHGDRTGQTLAQVITSHTSQITISNCKIVSAVCDGNWDLISNRQLP